MAIGIFDPDDRLSIEATQLQNGTVSVHSVPSTAAIVAGDTEYDVLVAAGESALLSLVREGIAVPLLPVGVDAGVPSVPPADLEAAVDSLRSDAFDVTDVPTIEATLHERTFRALMDVMAITAEPARISEYRTTLRPTGTVLDQVRADGVSVSGPAGTPGYGTAAGGPVLGPDISGLAVVPVGQFRTEHPHWVLEPPFEIEVVREEVTVSLVVDDRSVDSVPAAEPICFDWGPPVECVVLAESVSPMENERTDETTTVET